MPFAIGGNARIRTNIAAENAYNSLEVSNRSISLRQLRLSTGKRINSAADDVAGYITSRALYARNTSLKSAVNTVGDAKNLANIIMDSYENIGDQLQKIKEAILNASSGATGTDEKVALAKSAYRLAQQIDTVVQSTVFGGRNLIDGTFSTDFVIGTDATNNLIRLSVDLSATNTSDFNVASANGFTVALAGGNFAGIDGLNLEELNDVNSTDLGLFSRDNLTATLKSISDAINNVNKVAAFVGGIVNRLDSQEDLLKSQIVNYNAAISRIEDADVAKEQLELIKSQFLQQSSLISLAQANSNPQSFLQLIQG
ncbi:MAG: flagellin [Candidatus Kapabacteria bacterium]|nr:flagellin [Ignavibacteriota bacterium]MCW5883531.1 flagellin [Candidatus Kapabacteria bacterium]